MSSVVKQIDRGLNRYYEHQNAPYFNDDGIGKFQEWVDDNGYDSDGIVQEFQQAPEDITFLDFDDDFPIAQSTDDKSQAIFTILFKCYQEPAAFFDAPNVPDEQTQLQMATKQSLLQSNTIPSYTPSHGIHNGDHEPHISYIEPPHKKPHNHPDKHQSHHAPNRFDEDADIYGSSSDDDDAMDRMRHRYPQKQQQRDNRRNNTISIARDAMYESQLTSSNIQISSIKSIALRQQYEDALNLRKSGNKALNGGKYKQALKHYSKMFVCLGSNGIRRLHAFCNDDGAMNPLENRGNNVYTAMDKLRISAYTQMATVYTLQKEWDKVIDKCTKVLEDDAMNVKALLRRASAYREQNKIAQAKDDLVKAKNSGIVDIEVEIELNVLKNTDAEDGDVGIASFGGSVPITTFTNSNWPLLPLRDIAFEEWLRNTNTKSSLNSIPQEILYPVPKQKNLYKLYENEEILDMSVIWLDVEVAEKLMQLNVFDINKQKKMYLYQTYVNQLSTGNLCSGYMYDYNKEKFIRLLAILCENDADLELRDDYERTALANAVRNNMTDLGFVLIKYGANVNDGSVKKEIQRNRNAQDLIRKGLGILRNNTLEAIQDVMSMKHNVKDRKIWINILDCILSSWREETSVAEID